MTGQDRGTGDIGGILFALFERAFIYKEGLGKYDEADGRHAGTGG